MLKEGHFYEVLADRLSEDDLTEESAMDRGVRLESEAVEAFEQATGKMVDRVGFIESDDNEFMGCSPDGLIINNGNYNEAIEVKCLSSANHVRAWVENEPPKEHYAQIVQMFIVNEDLETLYFVLYDPRVTVHPLHIIPMTRESFGDDIADYKKQELEFISSINNKISELIQV